ncbi:PD-(D/E)XK nuclease family protein [Delftia sp. SD018]|uniref:PD-(D/E)XK nuclease family protein n=1 Tax=unclassified Delftia TaxID=2613839 RepID=UPI001A95AF93|nr:MULTISPECIES: PD-(D/E)XK nuclease family protein [unclassified Delftia]MBO0991351.1 PD-(D/E)XK nuclease family protein [Delftia sp. SD083]MBO1036824.1 PD-(D/E)XK nuclease family protein [Delftia sp. SD018]
MTTKAQIDFFLSDPSYLALIGREREHRLLFITDLSETRVSAFLGWLFRPQEGHGIGDQAFRELLLNVWRTNRREELGHNVLAPRDILGKTFSDLLVHTEYRVQSDKSMGRGRPIDLLLVSRQNKLVVAIENKYGSAVHSDQLAAYRKGITKSFPSYNQIFVYLDSNEGNKPGDDHWIPLGYQWLIDLISTHQKSGLLSNRSLDALNQFKDYLTEDLALSGQREEEKDTLIEKIAKSHIAVLNVFRDYRKERLSALLENPTLTINEPLLIEYHQRRALWNDVLDQARHVGVVQTAKRAFGDRLEVVTGPAEVRLRLKSWAKFEADPESNIWVLLVVAWSGREGRGKYNVWSFANFRGVDPDYEEVLRTAAIQLRGSHLKKPPTAAQWIRLEMAEGLVNDSAGSQVVNELNRLDKMLTTLKADA